MFRREGEFVGWLRRRAGTRGRGLALGIGDDAALVRPSPGRELILTSDWTIEDVHFRLKLHPPESVGHRALARALSDIAAMGGRPRWALVSLAIPSHLPMSWVKDFYGGMSRLARRFDVAIVGGDTSVVPDSIAVDVAVIGDVPRGQALVRSSARPGDPIFVSGWLGLSALGLKLLESGGKSRRGPAREALRTHLYPEPQCALGEFLARKRVASSMMDISDGLSTDIARLARASSVGARIWESLLPIPDAAVAAVSSQKKKGPRHKTRAVATLDTLDPLHLALHGGEDYQLLFTVPARKAEKIPARVGRVPLHRIGIIARGDAVRLVRVSGQVEPLKPAGFDHFRKVR